MTAADNRERYVDKVRKLLAKAEATTVQAEADAFYAKAAELITAWRIEDAELASADDVLDMTVVTLGTYSPLADHLARQAVFQALGLRCAFMPYAGRGTKPATHVFGWKSDAEKALLLWSSIDLQLSGSMRRAQPAHLDRNQLRVWRQSYKVGYANRVGLRLRQAVAVGKDRAEHDVKGSALVLVSREKQVDDFANGLTGGSRQTRLQINGQARALGDQHARNADLGQTRVGGTKGALGA